MLGNYVRDLAAKPLHGRVIEIERRLACGHGARSMTGQAFRVNRGAATIVHRFVILSEAKDLHRHEREPSNWKMKILPLTAQDDTSATT